MDPNRREPSSGSHRSRDHRSRDHRSRDHSAGDRTFGDKSFARPSSGHTVRTWSGRACRVPIDRDQFRSLLCFVEEMLAMQGCDNTLSHSETWARAYGVPWARLARGLRGIGGFCDCEIGMNVIEEGADDDY